MNQLALHNPFNAPVYHEDTVDSTMNVSRTLARQGEPHGTVIVADFQEQGRGRVKGRSWDMEKGSALACTVLLRFPGIENIPQALTLRTGLSVSLATEDFAPALAGRVLIKWPNDILVADKKIAGILTEADGGTVHIGIGINVRQKQFPVALQDKATSLSLAANREFVGEDRFALLEKILIRLQAEIEGTGDTNWRGCIEERLYKKGQHVCFAQGAADSKKIVNGVLVGIGAGGELLIGDGSLKEPASPKETAFTTGELILDNYRQDYEPLLFPGISEIV